MRFVDRLSNVRVLVDEGRLSDKLARTVVKEMLKSEETVAEIIDRLGLHQLGDNDYARALINEEFSRDYGDIRINYTNIFSRLTGKTNPVIITKLIHEWAAKELQGESTNTISK